MPAFRRARRSRASATVGIAATAMPTTDTPATISVASIGMIHPKKGGDPPQFRAATPSAQASTVARTASSSYEVIRTLSRARVT